MEMTFNKENPASLPLLMVTVSPMNSLKQTAKQPVGKEQPQPAATDFSEKLSAALDQSTKRVEIAGKIAAKKGPEKNLAPNGEEPETAIPVGVVPVTPEANNVQATAGSDLLGELKNAALQGITSGLAGEATVLPFIAQATVPAMINSPVLSTLAVGVANAVADLLTADKSNLQTAQNLQQMGGLRLTNGLTATGNEQTLVPVQTPTDAPPTQPPVNPLVSTVVTPIVDVVAKNVLHADNVTENQSAGVPDSVVQQAATPQQQGKPVNPQVLMANQPGTNQEIDIQQQIQQDMRGAKVSTVPIMPVDSPVLLKQTGKPVLVNPTEPAETENPAPVREVSQPAVETVVKTSTEQDLQKRSMAESETDRDAGLSEKNDASLSMPIGFDKVMASVIEPAVVSPPVAQPRPDLHEVVKQVMDGMISPTQQLKSSQVIITLKPEHLGEVTVKINVDGDKVTAAFHAASSEVRGILESSLPQLRQEMSQQGWQFDSDGVFGGMQEFLAQQQEQQQAQQQQLRSMINHARPDEYDDALAFSSNGKLQVMSATAVDYRV